MEDIKGAASFILEVTESKTLEEYSHDRLLRQAVERNFEIIGEATGRIARNDARTAGRISEHKRIIAFRNRLIHGYDLVDDELVWDTIRNQVPALLAEVEELIQERPA